MPLKGNAAFRYTKDGRETWLYLNAPLYDVRPARVRTRFTEESIDRRTLNVVVVDGGAEEITARLRFQGDPAALLDLLGAGADGETLEYFPDASLAESYPFRLMDASDIVAADPDPDRWWNAEYTVTLRLRRVDGGSVQALADNVLFRYVPGRTLAGATFTRASTATYRTRSGTLATAAADVLRDDHWVYEASTGLYRRATLLEGQRTNVLWDSSNFAAAETAWQNAVSFSIASVTSIIQGQAAYKHTNIAGDGFRLRDQTRGTFTGTQETFYVIIEEVDAPTCALAIWDQTLGSPVYRTRFTYATETFQTIEGTGTPYAAKLLARGPNGGGLWLLAITASGTAGNSRRLIAYPVGTASNDGLSAILHHAQHEEAPVHSSPIVTTASAGASRSADSFAHAVSFPWQALTLYARITESGSAHTSGETCVIALRGADGSLRIRSTGAGAGYSARLVVGASGSNTGTLTVPSIGQTVEFRLVLTSAGQATLYQSINGGAEEGTTANALTLPSSLITAIELNALNGVNVGMNAFRSYGVARGELTLAQCRARWPEHVGVSA